MIALSLAVRIAWVVLSLLNSINDFWLQTCTWQGSGLHKSFDRYGADFIAGWTACRGYWILRACYFQGLIHLCFRLECSFSFEVVWFGWNIHSLFLLSVMIITGIWLCQRETTWAFLKAKSVVGSLLWNIELCAKYMLRIFFRFCSPKSLWNMTIFLGPPSPKPHGKRHYMAWFYVVLHSKAGHFPFL